MASQLDSTFVPALIVVDMQEDFCPPNGSLAVEGGRTIAPVINNLLNYSKFAIRIATQDWHPRNHISFASNHPAPNNLPFTSYVQVTNPAFGKQHETKSQRLWPVHCVAGTKGADIIPEIASAGHNSNSNDNNDDNDNSSENSSENSTKIDLYVKKGMNPAVEMYSVFSDAFQNMDPKLLASSVDADVAATLRQRRVTDVFVVGLAGDYCVKYTAIDAARAGFRSYVVEDAVKSVDPVEGWEQAIREFEEYGVKVVNSEGPEVERVKS